ncbi:MAG: hypothetical protein ACREEE_05365, partial [Dongiaceae bacterium]
SYVEALRWYRRGAARNHAWSMYSIGTMYRLGQGVAKDPTQAEYWYGMAADLGLVDGERAAFWQKMRALDDKAS